MKERLQKYAPFAVYPLFYLFCLFIAFALCFPYDKLKERIVADFNAQQARSSSPQELQIDELESSFITGVKAKGIRLVSPPTEKGKRPAEIRIDSARARISLLSLLVGNKSVSFKVEAFDGVVTGNFSDTGKERAIDVELDGVDLSKVDVIAAQVGFPLAGRVFGTVKLRLPEGKASKGAGTIALEVRDVYAGNSKELTVKTPLGPFTLPRLKVGTLTVAGEAKDGQLKLSKVAASGGDVDVNGEGRVQMRELATEAQLDVALKFKINDAYRGKSDKTKLLFGAPGSKEPPMLEMDAGMKRSKTQDGYYQLAVRGTLGKPDVKPAVSGGPPTSFGGFKGLGK